MISNQKSQNFKFKYFAKLGKINQDPLFQKSDMLSAIESNTQKKKTFGKTKWNSLSKKSKL